VPPVRLYNDSPGMSDLSLLSQNLGSIFSDMDGVDYIEPSREFLGLMLAFLLLLVYAVRDSQERP
jgi:hypothetical protein